MRTFHVTVPGPDAEIAADRLWQLGVEAVGVDDPVDGRVELWTSVGRSEAALERAVKVLEPGWSWRCAEVIAPAETWRDHVSAQWYDSTGVVVPAWHDRPEAANATTTVTLIEPASSFGLGDHPTTMLTLGALAAHIQAVGPAKTLLDVGCGSGVLGIMAAQRGVSAVRSVDISLGAVEATRSNAVRNEVEDCVDVDTATLPDLEGPFDVIVANILAPVLVALASELKRLLHPAGVLIISGILENAHGHVLEALAPLQSTSTQAAHGWIAVTLARGSED